MVEEAAQQRIQAEMRAFKEADSAWIQPPQKWLTQASEDPRCLEKNSFFFTLIYLSSRRKTLKPYIKVLINVGENGFKCTIGWGLADTLPRLGLNTIAHIQGRVATLKPTH